MSPVLSLHMCPNYARVSMNQVNSECSSLTQVMSSIWPKCIESPQPCPPVPNTPAHLADPARELSTNEQVVKEVLENLGITEVNLSNSAQLDCRSPLTRVY